MAQDKNDIKTLMYTKGMIKDLNPSSVNDQVVTHARNAILATVQGDLPFYSNEPSNLKCVSFPYKFNGAVSLKDNRFVIFSSDNINSEIGVADLTNCTYTKLVNNKCLNLNNNFIVTGIYKQNTDAEDIVLFNDGYNPPRILNISTIPYIFAEDDNECKTKIYTNELDCEELLLFPKLSFPNITTNKSHAGNLPDGVYSVALAYSVNKNKFTDYYSLTQPMFINNKQGETSISINLSNLDRSFDEYQLVLVGTVNGVTLPKIIGYYNTSQSTVTVSDWENTEYETISNEQLVITKKVYTKAGIIASNSQYAMLADLTRLPQINTQYYSNQVKLQYVIKQYPEEYYKEDGTDIGFYRDENYNFYMNYIWNSGQPTELGQIPGRLAKPYDLEIVSGDDIYETYTTDVCDKDPLTPRWKTENTASNPRYISTGLNPCGEVIGYGDFGYCETTELYPNNIDIYGDNACKPIRLHQFPDEARVPRYVTDPKTGKNYINVLGFQVLNIPRPTDDKGNIIKDIVGYEIIRSDRDGANKTIIARGMLTNARGFEDSKEKVIYSNYPYNDLGVDPFLAKKQTYRKNRKESEYQGLDKVYKDKFNFYTPHGYFFEKYKMGTEIKFETEEIGTVTGNFEEVYKHPKHKLLTNFSLIVSLVVGTLEAYLSTTGKVTMKTEVSPQEVKVFGSGTTIPVMYKVADVIESTYSTDIPGRAWMLQNPLKAAKIIFNNVLKLAAIGLNFLGIAADFGIQFLETVRNFTQYNQYVYQYNSHVLLNKQKQIKKNNKRRKVSSQPLYLKSGNHSLRDYEINNVGKQESIFIELEKEVVTPTTKDNTRKSISQFKICDTPTVNVNSTASMFYGTSKIKNINQYGSIENVKPIKTHNNVLLLDSSGDTDSPVLFGGDCIIYKFAVNTKQPLFSQTLANGEFPDGQPFDYRLYRNIAYPRYWADFTEYDTGSLFSLVGKLSNILPKEAMLPNQKYNLDCKGNESKKYTWVVKGQHMYTHINGVLEFFAEADYNIAFRTNKNEEDGSIHQPHYSDSNKNLSYIFRSDRLEKSEGFDLDPSYKKLSIREIYREQIRDLRKDPIREKNSIIYSLPAYNMQKINNWQYFLPNNYFTFDEKDFGQLTGIHSLDQDRVAFLFSKSSPYISLGRDQLESVNGRKITIGDGGLFAQQPRELMHTDVFYGSSLDKYAFRATQFGRFYISRNQGKLFNFTDNLDEISRQGLQYHLAKYIPLQLLEAFPIYEYDDSPQMGVGYQIAFDNLYELVYICKRDYTLNTKYKGLVTIKDNKFYYNNKEVKLTDTEYFTDSSWTISYSPTNKAFSSFHDWHPDWIIQQENHFASVKDNAIWLHNNRCDSYCNFYGVDYPYELEQTLSTGQQTHIIKSFEWHNEVYLNQNNCKDRFHTPHETFSKVIVFNTEQNSGLRNLEYKNGRRPSETEYIYPKKETDGSLTVLYDKTEQHYRFNQFADLTKDRQLNTPMWLTHPNGYTQVINPDYINLDKPIKEQKLFRNYINSIRFIKDVSGAHQFINKYNNFKINYSIR